jgi:hypothetical protein
MKKGPLGPFLFGAACPRHEGLLKQPKPLKHPAA